MIQLLQAFYPSEANVCDCNGLTPLHYACRGRRASLEAVRILLQVTPRSLLISDENESILHFALRKSAPAPVVQLIVEAYPELVRWVNRVIQTPLHIACLYGAPLPVIQILLQHGPEAILSRDKNRQSPLQNALHFERVPLPVIECLATACHDAASSTDEVSMLNSDVWMSALGGLMESYGTWRSRPQLEVMEYLAEAWTRQPCAPRIGRLWTLTTWMHRH